MFLVGLQKQVLLCEDLGRVLLRIPSWEERPGLPWPVGALMNGSVKVIPSSRTARSQVGTPSSRTNKRASFGYL